MNKKFKKISILFVLVFSIFFYSSYIEPNRLVVKESNLQIQNWDRELNGMKIAVVSDLHIGSRNVSLRKVEDVVDLVNKQTPDLILLLGDFDSAAIYYSNTPQDKISETLANFKAPYGVYAIYGNHDYRPAGIVKSILEKSNILLLRNNSVYITFNNKKLRICGISDIWHEKVSINEVLGEINEPTLLLSHNPDIFPIVPSKVALTLSGHTHGGEVYLPILGAPFVPSVFAQKYSKGHIVENNKSLFVTSGIGCLSHFRLLNPPEVVILNLYSNENSVAKNKFSSKLLNNLLKPYNKRKFGQIIKCKQ